MATETVSLDSLLESLPADKLKEVRRLIYGGDAQEISIDSSAQKLADENNFEIKSYSLPCDKEQLRAPRRVRVAVIQNSIGIPTNEPVVDQYLAIQNKIEKMIDAAAAQGANVVCLQEAWTCPFFFCTRERYPWLEFSEDAKTGRSTKFLSEVAKKHKLVIVSPILERDEEHGETIHNTVVVIGDSGNYIGKHRKNHIPRVGDFNESTYYMEGNTGHPVFVTKYGKIAINICYGRHHPMNWFMFGLNGAEIVFNPSATVSGLSEPLWPIEARNAAIANSYFAFSINRVGTEIFPNAFTSGDGKESHRNFGHFYGSSYCSAPTGLRTPGLSRTRDGVLVTEIDLNLCRQIKDKWGFYMTNRLAEYAKEFTEASNLDYQPQLVYDPSLLNTK